jgi:glycosyltransferase involved in cell wall biosynthesis
MRIGIITPAPPRSIDLITARSREEMKANARYHWVGELPQWCVRRVLFRSQACVVSSSKMEGGANVVSEAIVAGVPVLASRIPGNVGILV